MSHAANLGRLEIIKAMAALGARDFQHAFDRAVLQGKIDCARWLHEHGAKAAPGIIMGACETLKPSGVRLLVELDAPFTDERGNRLAPLAMVLETYGRNPAGKHESSRSLRSAVTTCRTLRSWRFIAETFRDWRNTFAATRG